MQLSEERQLSLDLLLGEYHFDRKVIENLSTEMTFLMAYYLLQFDNLSGLLYSIINLSLNASFKKDDSQDDYSHLALFITISLIGLLTFLVLRYLPKDTKSNLYQMVKPERPNVQRVLVDARALARDSNPDLQRLEKSEQDLKLLVKLTKQQRSINVVTSVLFGYLPQLYYYFLPVSSYLSGDFAKSARNFSRSLFLTIQFIEYFKMYRQYHNQKLLDKANTAFVEYLLRDFSSFQVKRSETSALSYIGVSFKDDLNVLINIRIQEKNLELKVSYKDIFEAFQNCIEAMPTLRIHRRAQHSLVLASNVNNKTDQTQAHFRDIFVENLIRKHESRIESERQRALAPEPPLPTVALRSIVAKTPPLPTAGSAAVIGYDLENIGSICKP